MNYIISKINILSFIIAPIFYKLVYMSIIATIVAIVVIITRTILKKYISPKWISRIWIVFILTLIVPINISTKFSIYNYIPNEILVINNTIEEIGETSYREEYDNIKAEYKIKMQDENIDAQEVEELEKQTKETYIKSLIVDVIIPYTFLGISTILIITYCITYIIFNRRTKKQEIEDKRINEILERCKQKLNIKKQIKIIEQNYIEMPSIFGIKEIRILITEEIKKLTDQEIEYIIMHELAHYKRKDNLRIIIVTILKYIYIFNPIIWYMLKQMIKDMEIATDEIAIENLSQEEKNKYCKTLVNLCGIKKHKFMAKSLCISDEKENLKTRIKMIGISEKFQKNKTLIAIISVIIILVMGLVFATSKVVDYTEVSNLEKLEKYQNTYIGDNSKVNNILLLLPYAKHKGTIELQTVIEPYELTVNYNMEKNYKNLEYNNMVLFTLIQNLGVIKYNFLDEESQKITREEYEKKYELTISGIDQYINKEKTWGESPNYKLVINENGTKVFANSNLAMKQLKKDYKEAIKEIRKQFNLLPLNKWNYQQYKTYGWQVTTEDEKLREQCSKVSSFLDVYENGYNTYKISEEYPFKKLEIKVKNVANDTQDLGRIANLILSEYFATFYTEDIVASQKLSKFVPIKDTIMAGDKEEFVAKVECKIKSEAEDSETSWGTKKADGWIEKEVTIRIKRSGEGEINSYGELYVPYELIKIGDEISTEGLQTIDSEIPIRDY